MPIVSSCNPGEPGDFVPSVGAAKHPNNSVQVVDHTYRDLSRFLEYGGQIAKHKKSENNFPAKLHEILSSPRYSHVIVWMPHGRAWRILDKDLFMSTVVHIYFGQTRFTSFTRQLNNWGFKRLHQCGADYNCYYHECFLRGIPLLTRLMRRVPSNRGKFKPDAEGEPNFYQISSKYPLPDPVEHAHGSRASDGSSTEAEVDITSHPDASAQKKDSLRTSPPITVTLAPSSEQYLLPSHKTTDWTGHQNKVAPSSEADSLSNPSARTTVTSASASKFHFRPHEMKGWTRMCNSNMPLDYTASTHAGSPVSDWPSVPHVTAMQNETKPSGKHYNHSYQMPNHYESDFQFRSRSFDNPNNQSYYSYFPHPSNYAPTSCMMYDYPLYQGVHGHHSAQVQHQSRSRPQQSTSTSDKKQGESNRTIEASQGPSDDTGEFEPTCFW